MKFRRFSAYVEDVPLEELPKAVREDVERFVTTRKGMRFPQYGMVVSELVSKADPENLKTARGQVKELGEEKAKEAVMQAVKKGEKFVLVMNDRIIDGHHFVAKAERGGVTSSLPVLDLTPARFQLLHMSANPRGERRFSLAADKYRKKVQTEDKDRGDANMARAAVTGALAGVIAPGRRVGAGARAAIGALAGAGSVAALRKATEGTKDGYGERSRDAKKVEKLPAVAGVVAGAALLRKRLRKSLPGAVSRAKGAARRGLMGLARTSGEVAREAWNGAVRGTVGFSAQDTVKAIGTSVAASAAYDPLKKKLKKQEDEAMGGGVRRLRRGEKGTERTKGTWGVRREFSEGGGGWKGAGRDLGIIAAADLLAGVIHDKMKARKLRKKKQGEGAEMSAREGSKITNTIKITRKGTVREFRIRYEDHHSDAQGRDQASRFKSSLRAYVDRDRTYTGNEVAVTDAAVVRSAFRKAQVANRVGTRAGRLAGDAIGAIRGQEKVDSRGRPLRREWEKQWFRNAAVNTALTGAVLGGAALLRKNPKLRAKVGRGVNQVKARGEDAMRRGLRKAGRVAGRVTDIDRLLARGEADVRELDVNAALAGWDVRDPRGRSARVYAPGSGRRERREKHWYERVGNLRKIAVAGAGAALLAGGAGGFALGKRAAVGAKAPRVAEGGVQALRKRATRKGNVVYPAGMGKAG